MISCKYKWLVDRGEVFTLILPKEIKLISYRGYISRYITHVFLLKTATIFGLDSICSQKFICELLSEYILLIR